MQVFAKRIKELRKLHGLTQEKMAAILNYGSSAISNYERGKNQPSLNDLARLAIYFKVSADYLLGIENKEFVAYKPINLCVKVKGEIINVSIEELEE